MIRRGDLALSLVAHVIGLGCALLAFDFHKYDVQPPLGSSEGTGVEVTPLKGQAEKNPLQRKAALSKARPNSSPRPLPEGSSLASEPSLSRPNPDATVSGSPQDTSAQTSAPQGALWSIEGHGLSKGTPLSEITKLPRRLKEIKVPYPPEAKSKGIVAKVRAKMLIDPSGQIVRVELLERYGYGLDEAALSALKQFVFTPAYKGDTPVFMEILYTYAFELR